MIHQVVDGIGFELKEPHDFGWLQQIGRVFCAFDNLISGNICFGVDDGTKKYFVKYAGAATKMYASQPRIAVNSLKAAAGVYAELAHPGFSELKYALDLNEGFALVFPWFDGYALAPVSLHLERLQTFPLLERLRMYDCLVDAIVNANQKDHLAAGLSHQQILVNFEEGKALICSLDHFMRFPVVAPYPKLPGSSWFVPPEGYVTGTLMDERSNVYAQGALAFTFFGNPRARDASGWSAGKALYHLAAQAIEKEPDKRIASPMLYQKLWRETVLQMPRIIGV